MPKWTCLAVAGALAMPLPAFADCAQRIEVVEKHPALVDQSGGDAKEAESEMPAAASGEEEKVVKQQMVENGDSIQEDGGKTTYQDGGPAVPRESWFTDSKDRSGVLTFLDDARKAHDAGDERSCLESVEQAEKALEPDAG